MRAIDSKFQKKQTSDKEIADFKAFLIQSIYSYEQNKQVNSRDNSGNCDSFFIDADKC